MIPASRTPLSRVQQYALIALLTLTALPHVLNIDSRISALFLVLVVYRTLAIEKSILLPGKWLLLLITLGALGNVLMHYPILFGRNAGVALLTSMLALKLMEMRVRRDVHILVFIGYFTLVTQFLYRDDSWLVLYALILLFGLTAMLVESSRSTASANLIRPLGVSLSLLVQALPIMILLFILFPRFSSPLWSLGAETGAAVSGVSGNITAGSISRLSRSPEVAFRVDFNGEIPPPAQRYWRGPVFWFSDGKNWNADENEALAGADLISLGQTVDYSVTLEPTPGSWLYALELPVKVPRDSQLRSDYQLIRNTPVKRRVRYSVSSVLDYRTGPLDEKERQKGLQLPPGITPRMLDLVTGWQQQSGSDTALVLKALDYFRQQDFYYTLYPPLLGDNPADQFLFDTRRGFCEHYATSFTLLMRIAGIPARVVGGYQGGQVNPLGDYLIVRQSDAHAWAEVWLQNKGWQRVDPTVAVAPERIQQSIDPNLINDIIGAPILFGEIDSGLLRAMLNQLRWGADALNASWHRWVLGYSKESQVYLMRLLGLGFLRGPKLAYAMVGVTGLFILFLTLTLLYRVRERRDPISATYQRFCQRLQRRGLIRLAHEGPKDFAERVINKCPELAGSVSAISSLYIGIRYGRQDNKPNRRRFNRLVRGFRP